LEDLLPVVDKRLDYENLATYILLINNLALLLFLPIPSQQSSALLLHLQLR